LRVGNSTAKYATGRAGCQPAPLACGFAKALRLLSAKLECGRYRRK